MAVCLYTADEKSYAPTSERVLCTHITPPRCPSIGEIGWGLPPSEIARLSKRLESVKSVSSCTIRCDDGPSIML